MSFSGSRKVFTIGTDGYSDELDMNGVRGLMLLVPIVTTSIVGVIGFQAYDEEGGTYAIIYKEDTPGTQTQIYITPQASVVAVPVDASIFTARKIRLRTQVSGADASIRTQSSAVDVVAFIKNG